MKSVPHKRSIVKVSDLCIYTFATILVRENVKLKEFCKKTDNETLVSHSICVGFHILAT